MPIQPRFKSSAELKAWFHGQGINISEYCRQHGLDRQIVTDLMRGKAKGLRGKVHETAVALGLKVNPSELGPGPTPEPERRHGDRRHSA